MHSALSMWWSHSLGSISFLLIPVLLVDGRVFNSQYATYKNVLSEKKKGWMNYLCFPTFWGSIYLADKRVYESKHSYPSVQYSLHKYIWEGMNLNLYRLKMLSWWFWFNLCWKTLLKVCILGTCILLKKRRPWEDI